MSTHRVPVDDGAAELAQQMLAEDSVMRTILEETLDSAASDGPILESGRTTCGSSRNLKGPISREFRSVSLPTCPVRTGGAWHSHTSRSELLTPENSLPDTANVVFGQMDVSIVVGVDHADVVVGAGDRRRLQAAFQDALGVDVDSTNDVVNAVLSGEINPPAARQRVRSRFEPELMFSEPTGFEDLAKEVQALDLDPGAAMSLPGVGGEPTVACHLYREYAGSAGATQQATPDVLLSFERTRTKARSLVTGGT